MTLQNATQPLCTIVMHTSLIYDHLQIQGLEHMRYQSAQAAITKHRLGGLTHRNLLLTVLDAGSSRSMCSRVWFLERTLPCCRQMSFFFFTFFPSFIEVWLTNKNCMYWGCTMWFFLKAYNIMICYTYILLNDYYHQNTIKVINTSTPSHSYFLIFCGENTRSTFLETFKYMILYY